MNPEKHPSEASKSAEAAAQLAAFDENESQQLRDELQLAKEKALRAHAELENFRKRMLRDMDEERKYSNQPLLRDLLPVIDNIARALGHAEKSGDAAMLEGFKLVAQQLEGVLSRYQCTRIDALHKPFDPHLHQAIAQQPSGEFPPDTVLLVAQEGYQLHDRVLRPSQVIVSTAPQT